MTTQNSPTILVVDDDEVKRYTLTRILARAGFEVIEALTGAEALRLVRRMPDLIVLDVQLPDIDGREVCRRLKADPETASIPVLHISATYVESEDKVAGLESGADGYLTDVVEPLELLATVRALLRTRHAEDEARLAAQQWQATFEAIGDGVCLLGRSGEILRCNGATSRLLGLSSAELLGLPIASLMPTQGPDEEATPPAIRLLESGRRASSDVAFGRRWLHVDVDPIRDDSGAVTGSVCILSDITDRRGMEEELRRRAEDLLTADRQKDEFLAMLAHELRNPLAPIRNALEVIRLDPDPASVATASEMASRQVGHMARLLDDLLDVSRITSGKIELRIEPVDLNRLVGHAADAARPLIEANRHRLTVSLPPEPIRMMGDPTRLEQVFGNLLTNAAKYTEPGGSIGLTAERSGDEAVVTVVDDGIGLTTEMLPHVFDLFAQADRSLARAQGGLGIGLTLVRSLVQLHGGSVSARSDGPGLGSTFVVRLPVPTSAPTETAPGREAGGRATTTAPLAILIVDDSVDSARSLGRVLTLWGHRARMVFDGPAAIEAVGEEPTDLVLLDIGLPGMDGYEVASQLAARPAPPTLVALTGYGQEDDRRRARDAGFDHHLVKPVDLDDLQAVLAKVRPR